MYKNKLKIYRKYKTVRKDFASRSSSHHRVGQKQALEELKPRKVGLDDVSLEYRLHVCVHHDTCCPSHQAAPEQVLAGCRAPRQKSRAASEYL